MRKAQHLAVSLSFAAQALICGAAQASPGEATSWLMENPASMMDLGLHRVEHWLESSVADMTDALGTDYYTATEYDWENDEINLSMSIWMDEYSKDAATRACDAYVWRIRAYALVQPEKGTLRDGVNNSRLSDKFAHDGFARSNAPSDWKQKIDGRIRIVCLAFEKQNDGSLVPKFQMKGNLLASSRAITELDR